MKYEVGDKVRVRGDLEVNSLYGEVLFASGMKKCSGKTMTVDKIIDTCRYRLKEDAGHYNWSDEMLEDAKDINIIVKGDKVIAKMGNKVGIAKCSPEDEFDIFTGTRLAIDRLEKKCNPYSWLKKGVRYYVPSLIEDDFYISFTYVGDSTDIKIKERGIAFKTKEEAINCAKKMLEVVK